MKGATVTWTADPTGAVIQFDYSGAAVQMMKSTVPPHARGYDPERRQWTVHRAYVSAVIGRLEHLGYRVTTTRATPTSAPATADAEPFRSLFAVVPGHLREPLYRSMAKVLHPDAGGDTKLMQMLNEAKP